MYTARICKTVHFTREGCIGFSKGVGWDVGQNKSQNNIFH